MLDDLLDVSKIITGRFELKLERTDLWEETEKTVADLQSVIREHNIHLVLQPPDQPLPIQADAKRLRQAICHLLDNAVKFNVQGGTVTLAGRREDRTAVLLVQDTGRGIAPTVLSTLFGPFRQINRPESTAGLGLGLALVKGIVEMHGGSVSVASPGIGQGSTFTIMLPVSE